MSAGATKDYNFGQKNHWRRTVWNEIIKRTNGREKRLPVLYLAGPQDNDRSVAISKGVPPHNLIGIDRDGRNVERLRQHGGLGIAADMLDLLWTWPSDREVAAVVVDLCCGFEIDVTGIYDALARRPFAHAVAAFNLMRGRDSSTNMVRGFLSDAGVEPPAGVDRKHRGFQMLAFHALDTMSVAFGGGSRFAEDGKARMIWSDAESPSRSRYVQAMSHLIATNRPTYLSYRSGPLVFDSVIIEHPAYREIESLPVVLRGLAQRQHESEMDEYSRSYKSVDLAPFVSAALAVRTRKMQQPAKVSQGGVA